MAVGLVMSAAMRKFFSLLSEKNRKCRSDGAAEHSCRGRR